MTKYPLPEPPHEEEVDSGHGMDMEVLVILLYKISAAPHTSWSRDTGVSLIFPALIPSPSSPPPGHLMHMVHLKDEAGWCSHAELRTTMNKYYPPNILNVILDPISFQASRGGGDIFKPPTMGGPKMAVLQCKKAQKVANSKIGWNPIQKW